MEHPSSCFIARCLLDSWHCFIGAEVHGIEERNFTKRDHLSLDDIGDMHNSRLHHKSFSYYGMKIWNSLPVDIRKSKTVEVFKMKCKEHLMSIVSAENFEYSWTI